MKLICPKCSGAIDGEDVNVASDLAKCGPCDEVFKASELMADIDLSQGLEPPEGSAIAVGLAEPAAVVLSLPRRGFRWGDLLPMGFASVWLAFAIAWARSPGDWLLPVAISSLIGLHLWTSILRCVLGMQSLRLTPNGVVVRRRGLVLRRRFSVPYEEMTSAEVAPVDAGPLHLCCWPRREWLLVPMIRHGRRALRLAEHATDAEKEWLVGVIKRAALKYAQRKL